MSLPKFVDLAAILVHADFELELDYMLYVVRKLLLLLTVLAIWWVLDLFKLLHLLALPYLGKVIKAFP